MLQPDSLKQEFNPDNVIGNNNAINNDMISEIEKELQENTYDMISLVFLLYEVPDTALQRLIVHQRVSKDNGNSTNLNMLHEWFRHAVHTPTWKHEFVEALLVCQLKSVVRKIGINVPSAQNHYKTDNLQTSMYINPIKKALYKLCECMTDDNLLKLKKALLTYDIDTSEYESCELVLLKLMCDKFIIVNQYQYNKKTFGFQVQLDKLLKITESLPGLRNISQDIKELQYSINGQFKSNDPVAVTLPSLKEIHMKVDERNQEASTTHLYNKDFEDIFTMLNEMNLNENTNTNLKSDRTKLDRNCFVIKNPKRIGVCVILNQVNFYPSKSSIENANQCNALDKRIGSDKDKDVIEKTMRALNFSVYSATDLNHKEMLQFLIKVIKTKVSEDDSVFMLCLLSHGVRGHVYAADSVKVKMDDFQKLLDSDIAVNLHDKPKLLIVQACQVDEIPQTTLVADSPSQDYTLKKTNFLIYWATAPELEAYRDESKGSMFIQLLCRILLNNAALEHICDIFTKVTDRVTRICGDLGCTQVPIYHSTLRKKLYLKIPQ